MKTVIMCFVIATLNFMSFTVDAKDITAVLPDGRTVVLYKNGTWKILTSGDQGKIVVSIVSMKTVKDEDDYDACKITSRVQNLTKHTFRNGYVAVRGQYAGGFTTTDVFFPTSFKPGEAEEVTKTAKDLNCKQITRFETYFVGMSERRLIKGMKFKTEKEAACFVSKYVVVSSQHNTDLVDLKVSVPIYRKC
jgi:hypothetical protein